MRKPAIIITIFMLILAAQTALAESSSTLTISGTHIVENYTDLKAGQHTFVLTSIDGAPMPEGSNGSIKKVTVSSNEPFSFGDIDFTADGTYEYTVTRETEQSDRLEEDGSMYYASVIISEGVPTMIYRRSDEKAKTDRIIYIDDYYCYLTFDLNGGTLGGITEDFTQKYRLGETVNLPGAPEKDGYDFLYWKGSKYYAGQEYKVTEDHRLEAIYEKTADGKDNDKDKDKNSSKGKSGIATGESKELLFYTGILLAAAIIAAALKLKKRR